MTSVPTQIRAWKATRSRAPQFDPHSIPSPSYGNERVGADILLHSWPNEKEDLKLITMGKALNPADDYLSSSKFEYELTAHFSACKFLLQ